MSVPILGKPAEAFEGEASVVMRCLCKPSNKLFAVTSVNQHKVCAECGNIYGTITVSYDRAKGHEVVSVGIGLMGNVRSQQQEAVTH